MPPRGWGEPGTTGLLQLSVMNEIEMETHKPGCQSGASRVSILATMELSPYMRRFLSPR